MLVIVNARGFCVISTDAPFRVYSWSQVFSYGTKEHTFSNDALTIQIERPESPQSEVLCLHYAIMGDLMMAFERNMTSAKKAAESKPFPANYVPGANVFRTTSFSFK